MPRHTINIFPDNNQVILNDVNQHIDIIDLNTGRNVNITQPLTNVIQVVSAGPQGQTGGSGSIGLSGSQGPPGPSGSIPTSGSFSITGSFYATNISGSFTGSLLGTASYSLSGSNADTASFVKNSQTASYVLNAVSS